MAHTKDTCLTESVTAFFDSFGISRGATVLVAYSGGADSTALLAALVETGYRCRALHCNFHLRGSESDRDEAFSRRMAARLGCEISVVDFDVEARRRLTGESVEMACRELRYGWFARMFAEASERGENPACVAVAHHESDNIETFFLNTLRGSGLRGLRAIPPRRGIFMRPLLSVAKADIDAYLASRNLDFIVDSSNLSDTYRRNRVRNIVMPALRDAFPDATSGIARTISHLRSDYELLDALIERVGSTLRLPDGSIDLTALSTLPHRDTMLFHMLRSAVPLPTVRRILAAFDADESGRTFQGHDGATFMLDRGRLMPASPSLSHPSSLSPTPRITARAIPRRDFSPVRDPNRIWLDGSAAEIPSDEWELRPWRPADRIRPFGMKGSRLVSNILSDAKVPLAQKPGCHVLTCRGEIVWLIGFRPSRLFPVTPSSQSVIELTAEAPQ